MIRRLPSIGDTVWVGRDMRTAESCKGRVVLAIHTTEGDEVVYVVKLERPAVHGTRTVTAHARDLTIFPDY
jgi:hypothetical protein